MSLNENQKKNAAAMSESAWERFHAERFEWLRKAQAKMHLAKADEIQCSIEYARALSTLEAAEGFADFLQTEYDEWCDARHGQDAGLDG